MSNRKLGGRIGPSALTAVKPWLFPIRAMFDCLQTRDRQERVDTDLINR